MEVRKEDKRDPDEKVVEIEIERLRDFKNHPFKVQADSQMKELKKIGTIGVVKFIWLILANIAATFRAAFDRSSIFRTTVVIPLARP